MRLTSRKLYNSLLAVVIVWSSLFVSNLPSKLSQAAEKIVWRKGANYRKQLKASIGLVWKQNPLRSAVRNLSTEQRVVILLDRRVDPGLEINFEAASSPFQEVMEDLAARLQLRTCFFDGVVYLGPQATAVRLPTLMAIIKEDQKALPIDVRKRFAKLHPTRWEMLDSPRDIMQRIAQEANVRIDNLQLIPHDIWPAGELPALPLTERLSLLLAGFDLTWQWSADGTSIHLVPYSQFKEVARIYYIGKRASSVATKLKKEYPQAKIRSQGSRLEVTASFEDHDRIRRMLMPRTSKTINRNTNLDRLKFDRLNVLNQPVGGVMKYLAQRLELELIYDPSLTPILNKRISLELKDATYQQLFQAVLDPVGLTFRLENKRLEIVKKTP